MLIRLEKTTWDQTQQLERSMYLWFSYFRRPKDSIRPVSIDWESINLRGHAESSREYQERHVSRVLTEAGGINHSHQL